ncbi:hypothetical protein INR49_002277 [Caranx melampygus]|nr:hypothetical protein INR49_002277 [Caranx melampygus]
MSSVGNHHLGHQAVQVGRRTAGLSVRLGQVRPWMVAFIVILLLLLFIVFIIGKIVSAF